MKTGICCSKVLCHEPVRDDTHRHEVTRTGNAATTGSLWQEFSFSMNQSIDYPSSVNSAFTVTPNTLEHLLGMIRSPLYQSFESSDQTDREDCSTLVDLRLHSCQNIIPIRDCICICTLPCPSSKAYMFQVGFDTRTTL
jgi:hypothetical protein